MMVHARPKTHRERRHDQNVRRILETAMDMVAEGGFGAFSINKLAEAVEYTPGALYRYFGSKDVLLSQLIERVLDDVRSQLLAAQAQLPEGATSLAHVLMLAEVYRAFAEREPHRFGLLAMSLAQPRLVFQEDAEARLVMKAMWSAMQPLVLALAAAARDGQLAPGQPIERTLCVLALLQGVLPLRKRARFAPSVLDVDHLAWAGIRALLLGWGARPRAVDSAFAQVKRRAVRRKGEP